MRGLVEEIQRDALDPNVSVSTILRKVKAAAAKLKLPNVEEWVEHELNGYGGVEVPKYRKLHGRPQALNPYQGWIPIIVQTEREHKALADVDVRQSVSALEDLVARSSAGFVEMQYPPQVVRALNKGSDVELGRMSNHLAVTQIQAIIDTVRNKALDWSLELERAGISGEGYSFNAAEQAKAQQSGAITYNIHTIETFAGNMGSGNTSGDIVVSSSSISQAIETVRNIRAHLPDLEAAGADGPALTRALDAISKEAESQSPEPGKIRALLGDAKHALVGAAGNLTAEGAMALIRSALKLFGG